MPSINFRLAHEDLERLDALASAKNVSRTELVRQLARGERARMEINGHRAMEWLAALAPDTPGRAILDTEITFRLDGNPDDPESMTARATVDGTPLDLPEGVLTTRYVPARQVVKLELTIPDLADMAPLSLVDVDPRPGAGIILSVADLVRAAWPFSLEAGETPPIGR